MQNFDPKNLAELICSASSFNEIEPPIIASSYESAAVPSLEQ